MATFFFPNAAARGRLLLLLMLTLLFTRALRAGQETTANFEDLSARAAAARDQQNLPVAIQLYTQAVRLKPDWQEGWWYLGVLQYGANQFPGAIDAFTHLLELAPTAVPAMALRGLCEFETAAYDDSLRDLEQAVAHGALNEPHNEEIIRSHLAQLLARAGRFQDAIEQYRVFAEHHLDVADLKINIGLAGMRVPAFAQELSSQDRDLYQAAGSAGYIFLSGDNEQADVAFGQLFARFPTKSYLHYFYGFLLFPKDPGLAIDQFHDELAVDPTNETANALLAFTLVIAGRFNEALEPAQRAYAKSPDTEISQLALGRSLAETGDTTRGKELLSQVIARDPRNLDAHLGMRSIYSRSGNREEAERERKVCLDLAK